MLNKHLDMEDSFLWARETFFNSPPKLWKGYVVVHGHTPSLKLKRFIQTGHYPHFHLVGNDLVIRRNGAQGDVVSVGIDSGSTISGRLSGLGIFVDQGDGNGNPYSMRSLTVTREDIFPRELGPIGS